MRREKCEEDEKKEKYLYGLVAAFGEPMDTYVPAHYSQVLLSDDKGPVDADKLFAKTQGGCSYR